MKRTPDENTNPIRTILPVAVYLLLATVVCIAVARLCYVESPVAEASIGVVDLTGVDFDAHTVTVQNFSFLLYPREFHMPEDFAAGRVEETGISYGVTTGTNDYGTVKVFLKLPPGVYAISSKNASYAQRLFIDGVERVSVGWPGDSLESTSPKTTRYVQEFTSTGEPTEIIIQYAAFVHSDEGGLYNMEVGSVANVARNQQLRAIRVVLVSAGLVVSTLFFFGLFLLFRGSYYLLWFSLLCGCISLRSLFVEDKIIMVLLPDLDWFLAIRLEFLFTLGIALFTALYLYSLFPVVKRWILWIYAAFCAGAMLFLCVTPPVLFSLYLEQLVTVCAVFIVALLAVILIAALRRKLQSPLSGGEQILLLAGMVFYVALTVAGINAHLNALLLFGLDYTQVGMVVFLFLNMLALVMGFSRTERELSEARRNEREMEQTNRTLQRLNHIRTAFLQNITHEMKTPLTAIKALAQVVNVRLQRGELEDGKALDNLDGIVTGAERLSDYVDRLLQLSVEQEDKLDFAVVDVSSLFRRVEEITAPLLRERGNRLAFQIRPGLPPLTGVEEMLVQVLMNLITNANRHSRDSEILLSARVTDGMAEIRVTDHGEGIPADLLHQVFRRGVSGDDSTGLGLANCKEIVETHGGQIWIDSDIGVGTRVWFAIPLAKEEVE